MYYKNQLKKLNNSKYYKNIKMSDSQGNQTNTLDLNLESIPILIKYLLKKQKRLKSCKK